jgi:hypothetical protein
MTRGNSPRGRPFGSASIDAPSFSVSALSFGGLYGDQFRKVLTGHRPFWMSPTALSLTIASVKVPGWDLRRVPRCLPERFGRAKDGVEVVCGRRRAPRIKFAGFPGFPRLLPEGPKAPRRGCRVTPPPVDEVTISPGGACRLDGDVGALFQAAAGFVVLARTGAAVGALPFGRAVQLIAFRHDLLLISVPEMGPQRRGPPRWL